MKKRFLVLCLTLCLLSLFTACAAQGEAKPEVRIGVLKGPTGMGAAKLMAEQDAGTTKNEYAFTLAGAPDILIPQLLTGELDMAALPTNTIAMLSAKSNGDIQVLAVNTLGALYLMEKGDSVAALSDLAGKTIVCAGRGTTVEAIATLLLEDAAEIRYVSEHAEAVALAVQGQADLVLLPEPFVTSLMKQNDAFHIALDLNAVWEEQGFGTLPMGGIAVRKAFVEAQPEAVKAFLDEYAASVTYANENSEDAGTLIEQYDIMAAAVAVQAIPRANMVTLTGEEMRQALAGYYEELLAINPQLIGGALPGPEFYATAP